MSDTLAVVGSPRSATTEGSSLLARVCELASSDPGRVAVVGDDVELGYSELWQRALEVAARLGDRPGVVGVPAVHEPATVVWLLGVWAAGGSYCPIDPSFPADRVETMLASVGGLDAPVDPDVAYVLFTSGSTGRPKPVAVPHRALEAVVPALGELFAISPDDRVLQFASLNWDTAFEEILPTLATGAAVVFGADAHTGSLPRLLRLVERRGVSVLDLPTAMWHELVLHLSETRAGLPESVRLCVIGGEPVNPARLSAWRDLPGIERIRLLNTYGATETALITHAVDLCGPAGSQEGAPIGRPLGHVGQRFTDGGELLVGGPSLALGYPGLPEATAERFVEIDGERYFRTGDLVRESGGLLHHLGRLDAQVKVRGIRVDPGEVEELLLRHPGVAAAAVIGVTASERTVLAAYVVPAAPLPADEQPGLVAELRGFVRGHAPCHLHPARLTIVPALALTASGKADRRATHALFGAPTSGSIDPTRAQEATT
jgi:non-ribosomal peptide synthetase component F